MNVTLSRSSRSETYYRERLEAWIASSEWAEFVQIAEDDVIAPLRQQALTTPDLDPREQTGIVRALEKVRALLYAPYERLAIAEGKSVQDILPERITRLFV